MSATSRHQVYDECNRHEAYMYVSQDSCIEVSRGAAFPNTRRNVRLFIYCTVTLHITWNS